MKNRQNIITECNSDKFSTCGNQKHRKLILHSYRSYSKCLLERKRKEHNSSLSAYMKLCASSFKNTYDI